jgi:hypothetical protein
MDTKTITNHLQQMKGNYFRYANQVHAVIDFTIDEERFEVVTDINRYSRKLESAEEFLKYWSPVDNKGAVTKNENNQIDVYIEQEKSQADDLIGILKDNISKVQADAKYIPQAQAINDNINSIIDIQKMKLDYIKQFRKNW